MISLFRKIFQNFEAYTSGKSLLSGDEKIFLDTNENPFDTGKNRYPSPLHTTLRKKIIAVKNKQFSSSLSEKNFLLGNGSDEWIDLLVRLLCEPFSESIAILPPTYGMYSTVANLNGVEIQKISLIKIKNSFEIDFANLEKILKETPPKILFFCNPNNPTGTVWDASIIKKILQLSTKTIVVVDEAYIDFSKKNSALPLLPQYSNLVVLQTFSKAWGLAGMRCGCVFANEEIIAKLAAIKMPYNVNVATAQIVEETVDDAEKIFVQRDLILSEKNRLKESLQKLSFVQTVFESEANFLLVEMENAQSVFETLKKEGIVVRDFSTRTGTENCLRFTIGTPEENDVVVEVLKSI